MQPFQPDLDFSAAEQAAPKEAFVVDLDGYEGPLHVLLELARHQRVDLLKLSITELAEQYLRFVHEARRRFARVGLLALLLGVLWLHPPTRTAAATSPLRRGWRRAGARTRSWRPTSTTCPSAASSSAS